MTRRLALALLVFALACGCRGDDGPRRAPASAAPGASQPAPEPAEYRATIRWTSHGIPHIEANNLAGLSFGQGYAFASLHACVLADQIIKVRSERARYFGPGDDDANLDSDFGYLAIGVYEEARRQWPAASADSRQIASGFVAGYNRFLTEVGAAGLPADCAGAAWVAPIDEVDLIAHAIQTTMLGSSAYFVEAIGATQPPGAGKPAKGASLEALTRDRLASNAWAIGAEKSATGRGLLVANPHFPWEGALRFYEAHLTIPGALDAYGVNLLGLPLLSFGFNQHLGWAHTFSSSKRFLFYRLTFDGDGDATRYAYGGERRELEARAYSIRVRQPDGSLAEAKRTLYRSHYGPMLALRMLPWDDRHAYSLRDVTGAPNLVDQYLGMMRATSLDEFKAAIERHQATPFVNTLYADAAGNAWYLDGSAVPDLSVAALAAWKLAMRSIPELKKAWDNGVAIVDGSLPLFELQSDPRSAVPGAIAFERAPQLLRRDYVLNANDPYWLTNPNEPLSGYSPLYGEDDRAPSQRTRMNHVLVRERDKLGARDLEDAILANRAITAELLRDEVVARCKTFGRKLAKACATLAAWDGRYDLDSRGALLWLELVSAHPQPLWAEPFDRTRPLDTPRGLAPAPAKGADPLRQALVAAIERLERADLDPYTATVGDAQFTEKHGRRIAVHGSDARVGITNPVLFTSSNSTLLPKMEPGNWINRSTGLSTRGYPVNYGSSFVMVLEFTDDGPRANAITTYSASSDPRSPHFADQTEMYSRKQWRPVLFTRDQIEADPNLRVQQVAAPARPAAAPAPAPALP